MGDSNDQKWCATVLMSFFFLISFHFSSMMSAYWFAFEPISVVENSFFASWYTRCAFNE